MEGFTRGIPDPTRLCFELTILQLLKPCQPEAGTWNRALVGPAAGTSMPGGVPEARPTGVRGHRCRKPWTDTPTSVSLMPLSQKSGKDNILITSSEKVASVAQALFGGAWGPVQAFTVTQALDFSPADAAPETRLRGQKSHREIYILMMRLSCCFNLGRGNETSYPKMEKKIHIYWPRGPFISMAQQQ